MLTGKPFISLARELLQEGYQFILSERLVCQDSVENFFGKQRQALGGNNAPTVAQVQQSNRIFSVTHAAETAIRRGNVRLHKEDNCGLDDTPLPKRKRRH